MRYTEQQRRILISPKSKKQKASNQIKDHSDYLVVWAVWLLLCLQEKRVKNCQNGCGGGVCCLLCVLWLVIIRKLAYQLLLVLLFLLRRMTCY
jgi:hypothetical protein